MIALYLDRLGISYFLDVDHLLANHDLKALTASCEYFLYIMSEEWLKDVQLPMPESQPHSQLGLLTPVEQHKADFPVEGQFEGEHWKGRHNSWCRQELATALEVIASAGDFGGSFQKGDKRPAGLKARRVVFRCTRAIRASWSQ